MGVRTVRRHMPDTAHWAVEGKRPHDCTEGCLTRDLTPPPLQERPGSITARNQYGPYTDDTSAGPLRPPRHEIVNMAPSTCDAALMDAMTKLPRPKGAHMANHSFVTGPLLKARGHLVLGLQSGSTRHA